MKWKYLKTGRYASVYCRELLTSRCPVDRIIALVTENDTEHIDRINTSLLDALQVPYNLTTHRRYKVEYPCVAIDMNDNRIAVSWYLLIARETMNISSNLPDKVIDPFKSIKFSLQPRMLAESYLGFMLHKAHPELRTGLFNGPASFAYYHKRSYTDLERSLDHIHTSSWRESPSLARMKV